MAIQKEIDINGLSFHGTRIKSTVEKIKKLFGPTDWEYRVIAEKSQCEWCGITDDGHKFTIYDWKENRSFRDNEPILFHIGGESKFKTEQAKNELKKLGI